MKNLYINLLILCLLFSSCKKFLDIKSNSSQVFVESAQDCQLLLNNYDNMNTKYPSDGQASTDDYYIPANNYGSISNAEDRGFYTWDAGAMRGGADPQWQAPYRIVYYANLVLENAERLKGKEPEATLNSIKGQALFFRAYSYWNLAQLFCKPYGSTAGTDPGIPIRLSSDMNGKSVRGTVQQTYAQIVSDLQQASDLLYPSSPIASQPNKVAAYAMLARVFLSMEDYPQALTNASAALDIKSNLIDYNTISTTSTTPFVRFNPEVIFHSIITSSPLLNPGTSASNAFVRINDALYASYEANDLRKSIFFKGNTISVTVPNPTPQNPNATTNVVYPDGTYRFTGNYEPVTTAVLFNGLAVDELYLIRAECYARAGDAGKAMDELNALLGKRFVTGTYTNQTETNAKAALGIVLKERRKELVMRGQRWTDLRRLNKDLEFKKDLVRELRAITTTVTGVWSPTNNPVTYTITVNYPVQESWNLPANDPRYTLLIPNEVILFGEIPQNQH